MALLIDKALKGEHELEEQGGVLVRDLHISLL